MRKLSNKSKENVYFDFYERKLSNKNKHDVFVLLSKLVPNF